MNTTMTNAEKNLFEVKNYLKRCQNHIFYVETTNTYFRVSLYEDRFIVHTLQNDIISTREYFFASIASYPGLKKYNIKYILFNRGIYNKSISVKKRKNLVF